MHPTENTSPANQTAESDEWLAALLEKWIDRDRSGEPVDLDAVIASRPELERDIRELWATAMIAEDLGSLSGWLPGSDRTTAGTEETGEADETPQAMFDPVFGQREFPFRIDDYEILEELGRGGMGVVYKARQLTLGRTVALKMILQGEWASRESLRRFRSEAAAAARLNHPNIVPVYEIGELEGRPFFTMKYIEGENLGERLAEGPLPSREAAELLRPICHAIAEAHRQGVWHRDLKVSNILIDREGRPYVSDFGLAKTNESARGGDLSIGQIETVEYHGAGTDRNANQAASSVTATGAILGTPSYMAPEQAAGRRGDIGATTDVYSLGAILYAMLTGRPPFQAVSPVDTVLMVLEQDPLPPRLLNGKVDPDLEMVTLKCLQKPSDLRYQSATALADDLGAFLRHEQVSARSSQFTQILSRAFRETHHAGILENWGILWMWHSLVLLVLCVTTNLFQFGGIDQRWPYVMLWVLGLSVWAGFFWTFRRRSGPITFVERQIAHVWAGSVIASSLLFAVEAILHLPVLTLSPVLGIVSGMVFLAKAGILSGRFYVQAIALFSVSAIMAAIHHADRPDWGITLFGVVSAACFFHPGLKYYRQSIRR